MKTLISFFLLSLFTLGIFADEVDGEWHGSIRIGNWNSDLPVSWFSFSKGRYKLDTTVAGYQPLERLIPSNRIVEGYYDENGTISIENTNGLPFMSFKSDTGFTLKKRLGVLISQRRLFLFDNDSYFFEPDENASWLSYSPEIISINTSSSLAEKDEVFDGKSFIQVPGRKLRPWAEGVSGDGVGEWIEFGIVSNGEWGTSELLIINGFVSFVNPSLFKKNNRVREYRITSPELAVPIEGTLKDTTAIQIIKLQTPVKSKVATFRLTILSVYKGEKWDDTCLSLLYPLPPLPPTKFGPK